MLTKNIQKTLLLGALISSLAGCVVTEQNNKTNIPIKTDSSVLSSTDPVISKNILHTQDSLNKEIKTNVAAKKVIGDIGEKEKTEIIISPIEDQNKRFSNVKFDPNVQLISPPINLPKQNYDIPHVDAKENYSNSVKIVQKPKPTETIKVIVKKGDTLFSIAKKHHVSTKDLIQINHLKSASSIKVGQSLIIGEADEPSQKINSKSKTKVKTKKKKHS